MKITVNGKKMEMEEKMNLLDLVSSFTATRGAVIVELNENVVSKDDWKDTLLKAHDRVELVTLVGGG